MACIDLARKYVMHVWPVGGEQFVFNHLTVVDLVTVVLFVTRVTGVCLRALEKRRRSYGSCHLFP